VERADNAAFEDAPKALNRVGMHRADNVLAPVMIDREAGITFGRVKAGVSIENLAGLRTRCSMPVSSEDKALYLVCDPSQCRRLWRCAFFRVLQTARKSWQTAEKLFCGL